VKNTGAPFYLTGGTALSRHYYQIRYSDDLDLFVNSVPDFNKWIEKLFNKFEDSQKKLKFKINYDFIIRRQSYTQILLEKHKDINLKIDFVNDVAPRYGQFENNKILGSIDGWRNILSNKITAIFRFEAKDIVDLWILSKKNTFNWKEIIHEANTKEAGVDPTTIFEVLRSD